MTETETKERPIIFGAESVHAIKRGEKTQTRRVIKPQPRVYFTTRPWARDGIDHFDLSYATVPLDKCPYGRPGDVLWVRETFAVVEKWGTEYGGAPYEYDAFEGSLTDDYAEQLRKRDSLLVGYRADDDDGYTRWRSPIHMPRWASRLTLLVEDVRVERLQEITPHDALAEGVQYLYRNDCPPDFRAIEEFRAAWDRLNRKRGYPWESNPWVWAVTFRPVEA